MLITLLRTIAPLALLGLATAATAQTTRPADTGAVIFMYHRFGEDAYPSTNIGLDRFAAHVAELASTKYRVLPLPEIIAAFESGAALPDRTLAITIDDAFHSVYTEAWPRLKKAGLPFTLFVATDPIDQRVSGYMTWDQLRELAAAGVTIGNHTGSHGHMPTRSPEQNARDIAQAQRRLETELGVVPQLFAYPLGENGRAVIATAQEAGFAAAFGQHSGVAHAGHARLSLPRFALSGGFGSLERLTLAANALPLPMDNVTPADTVLGRNPPEMGFTVAKGIDGLGGLACYASHESGPARLERLGERRFEIRFSRPFGPGRGRVNCTLAAGNDRWRWFGLQFYIPGGPD